MEIIGLSVTGKAASELQEASQIKSGTIAGMIGRDETLHGKLVIIDEASMLSIRDMNEILSRCDENSKVVLIGDTKQLQTIGQGKIFSSLQEKEIISSVRMAETIRQSGSPEYKDIVDILGNKEVDAAYQKLDQQGAIKEITDRDKRLDQIVKHYLESPRDTMIVTAFNQDREQLNKMIRDSLIEDEKVSSNSINLTTREAVSIIGAERSFAESYQSFVGSSIIATKDGIFGNAGSEATILGINEKNQTLLVSYNGDRVNVDVNAHGNDLQIYKHQPRQFATGDKIIFLKNDKQLEVKNGQTAIIQDIDDDKIMKVKMDNGKTISFNPEDQYRYIGHGYAITDYKSQGQTEKHVIYHADTDKKLTFNQAYVAITRGKESVTIYTSNKEQLQHNMGKEQIKTSTLDHKIPESFSKIIQQYSKQLSQNQQSTKINNKTKSLETEKPKENVAQRTIDRSQGMER